MFIIILVLLFLSYYSFPTILVIAAAGHAMRQCSSSGEWNAVVDITGCSKEIFEDIINQVCVYHND